MWRPGYVEWMASILIPVVLTTGIILVLGFVLLMSVSKFDRYENPIFKDYTISCLKFNTIETSVFKDNKKIYYYDRVNDGSITVSKHNRDTDRLIERRTFMGQCELIVKTSENKENIK